MPSLNVSCVEDCNCISLSQLANDTSKYIDIAANVSLIFLPGSHTLDTGLILSDVYQISMSKGVQTNEPGPIFIDCSDGHSAMIKISNTTFISMTGLYFVGCGGVSISNVSQFVIQDTTFQGKEGRRRLLSLHMVTDVIIADSSFFSNRYNTLADNSNEAGGVVVSFGSSLTITNCTFANNSATYGGVFKLFTSSFVIADSTFENNTASYGGGVIYSFSGTSYSITRSTFSNNCASFGGVMQSFGSSFTVVDSDFIHNCAFSQGGVMYTLSGSSFSISGSTYFNNSAYCGFRFGVNNSSVCGRGGVMVVFDSIFNITESVFNQNIATQRGGVMEVVNSSFDITDSTFLYNFASRGAVLRVWMPLLKNTYSSSFSIRRSNFSSNFASAYGGVMETTELSFDIRDSTFSGNTAFSNGGCMYVYSAAKKASVYIGNSTFTGSSSSHGGVIQLFGSSLIIENSTLVHNRASQEGIIAAFASPINITDSVFAHNRASTAGVLSSVMSNITSHLIDSTFFNNSAAYGGVLSTSMSTFRITACIFENNSALYGGVLRTFRSVVTVVLSAFSSNVGSFSGGVMYTLVESSVYVMKSNFVNNRVSVCKIADNSFNPFNSTLPAGGVLTSSQSSLYVTSSVFANNCAPRSGVMELSQCPSVNITNSTFDSNMATHGAVMATHLSTIVINQSTLCNNSADMYGGVIATSKSEFDITNSMFSNNSGSFGGVIFAGVELNVTVSNCTFTENTAKSLGLFDMAECSLYVDSSTFSSNTGSLHVLSCNVTVSGHTRFENSIEPHLKKNYVVDATTREGGAITVYHSNIMFTGVTSFSHNQASYGGAILATESILVMYGETMIAYNVGNDDSGGGIYLHQSSVNVHGNCWISHNQAARGGGVHVSSSTMSVYQPGTILFVNNSATLGGAVYFEESPRLNVFKRYNTAERLVALTGNHAKYGGAMFVADDTSSSSCSSGTECFIQTLALSQSANAIPISTLNIIFSDNSADVSGSNIYGGLLDRCIPSPFAEIYLQQRSTQYDGNRYLEVISNIVPDSIASTPVRVCFCNVEGQVDCDLELDTIRVMKGEAFPVSVAAIDQASHPINATITSLLSSSSVFGEGQQRQHVVASCTDISFNVYSRDTTEVVTIFADGPCGSAAFSTRQFTIEFLNCTCSIGFQPSEMMPSNCVCVCDPSLSPYIEMCNYSTDSLLRTGTDSWITFTNDTYPSGYIIHPNCPFDYCHPPFVNVSLNLNLQNGSDAQCAYSRAGVLCGACRVNLSISLGSSLCLECPRHWPAVFIVIVVVFILAGLLLVAVMLALNLTVATGLITSFIFYANIVAVNNMFFSNSAPGFATVFVAWLNLDIGFDVCFFDGLDTYTKTWLKLAFPLYIITLVVVIIIVSRKSPKFTRLIGRRDPVSTLATLILLSYAKMLSVTIDALSFAVLDYPDGSQDIVWLPDGTVKYCRGKHIGLFIVALFIILVGVPYTFLLFGWQVLVQFPRWSCLKWTRNTKLNSFISTYHTPYSSKHRYWTGLTLLMRVVLYITAATTESSNPKLLPLLTIVLVGGLVFMKGIFGMRIYSNLLADIVDTIINFNILSLAVFSLYDFKTVASQIAVVYTSTIISVILLLVVVVHQVYQHLSFKKCGRYSLKLKEYPQALRERLNHIKVTHSVIEAPDGLSSSPENNNDAYQIKLIDCDVQGYDYDY